VNTPINADERRESSDDKHDIFLDPVLAQNMSEDPLFQWFSQWWRQIATFAVALVVIVYAKGVFEENRAAELAAAADTYAGLQEAMAVMPELDSKLKKVRADAAAASAEKKSEADKLVSDTQAELERAKSRIENVLGTLAATRGPYPELARFHRGLLSAQAKDFQNAATELNPSAWKGIAAEKRAERLLAELAALVYARAGIDDQNQRAASLALLNELGDKGAFVAASALVTLSALAQSPEEKAALKGSIERLLAVQPEQTDLMQPYLDTLS
jgi:hypothetical protein